jgi:hypothetical protein
LLRIAVAHSGGFGSRMWRLESRLQSRSAFAVLASQTSDWMLPIAC